MAHTAVGTLIKGVVAFMVLVLALPHVAFGQVRPRENQTAAAQAPALPDAYKMDMLIRTTLIALSQANLTGNYTVLRDLGSPSFQSANTAARLTEAFAELRQRKLDFSPILFFNPKLVRQPAIDDGGRLRLTGFMDTRPERINFDMMFERVGGDWRLFGIAVQMQTASVATAASGKANPPAVKEKAAAAKEKAATKTSAPAKK